MVGIGIGLKKGARNAPTALNSMLNELQFWDGLAATLEEQAKMPIINPIEMVMKDHDAVVARGKRLDPDDPKMRALEAYIMSQRKGVPMEFGKH